MSISSAGRMRLEVEGDSGGLRRHRTERYCIGHDIVVCLSAFTSAIKSVIIQEDENRVLGISISD